MNFLVEVSLNSNQVVSLTGFIFWKTVFCGSFLIENDPEDTFLILAQDFFQFIFLRILTFQVYYQLTISIVLKISFRNYKTVKGNYKPFGTMYNILYVRQYALQSGNYLRRT